MVGAIGTAGTAAGGVDAIGTGVVAGLADGRWTSGRLAGEIPLMFGGI
jgi:hypothetical protein